MGVGVGVAELVSREREGEGEGEREVVESSVGWDTRVQHSMHMQAEPEVGGPLLTRWEGLFLTVS